MVRCECLKKDGKQCTRQASVNPNQKSQCCWQHQNCLKNISKSNNTNKKKPQIHKKQVKNKPVLNKQVKKKPIQNKQVKKKPIQNKQKGKIVIKKKLIQNKPISDQIVKMDSYLSPIKQQTAGDQIVKMDLYLSPIKQQTAGDPKTIIRETNNEVNKFLVNADYSTVFEFNDTLNKQISGKSRYLGAGSFTAVFAVDKIKSSEQMIPNDSLIIRMIDPNKNLDKYLHKWKEDSQVLPKNIPKIYLSGRIFKDKTVVAVYTLVKKYSDISQIDKLDMNNKEILLQKLLEVLKTLQLKNYTYRDLTPPNIGYEEDHLGNIDNVIVLDHDRRTILNINAQFFNQFDRSGCEWYCAGTYVPYYIIDDYLKKTKNWRSRLDKLSVFGLATIIIRLFYGELGTYNVIIKHFPFSTLSYQRSSYPYENAQKLQSFINDVMSQKPLYGQIGDSDDQFIKNSLIMPLLSPNYDLIPSFSDLLNSYNAHFGL
jgi:hypothetical protein